MQISKEYNEKKYVGLKMSSRSELPVFVQRRLEKRSGAFGFKERTIQADFVEATTLSGKEIQIIGDNGTVDLTKALVNLAQQQVIVQSFTSGIDLPIDEADLTQDAINDLTARIAEDMGFEQVVILGISDND